MNNFKILFYIFTLLIACIIIGSYGKITKFFTYTIPTLWWKITKKKDPIIKEALWGKTLEEHNNYYLLKKDWKLLGVKMHLDKTIQIQIDGDATFTANSCAFVGRGCKCAFNLVTKERESRDE